jgi:hypothetical protein
VQRESKLDKLPSKGARFAFFNALGVAADLTFAGGLGTATSLGLSFADSFVADKVLKGWKPSVFVAEVNKALSSK